MYIDYLKSNYENVSEKEKNIRIARDKKHLAKLIREDIEINLDQIVERWWSLNSSNSIFIETDFTHLHSEAENHYYFGRYYSCIILVGVAVEEVCKSLVSENKITDYIKDQAERLKLLKKKRILNQKLFSQFDRIRKYRNDCVHFNSRFKALSESETQNIARDVLNIFKDFLEKFNYVEDVNQNKIDKMLIENNNPSFESFKLRQRNIDFEQTGIDLQINEGKSFLYNTSYFMVDELDIESGKYNEITLVDLMSGFLLIVDLTLPDIKKINDMKIEEGNVITASFISKVSTLGITEEWKLMEIHDVFRGEVS